MKTINLFNTPKPLKFLFAITVLFSCLDLFAQPSYSRQFGSNGTGNGQMANPEGIDINPVNGYLYLCDRNNERIQYFSLDSSYQGQWGSVGTSNGQFGSNGLNDLAITSTGNIWAVDRPNHRIQKFSPTGTYLGQLGTTGVSGTGNGVFDNPEGIAINQSNNQIYITDRNNERIQYFDSSGSYLGQWGSLGTGNGQFASNAPTAVAITSTGNVWVVDRNNHRVQKFSAIGTYLGQFGSSGSGNGQLSFPIGVYIDGDDNIYVADKNNERVQIFDSSGTYVSQFGSLGSGNGQFADNNGVHDFAISSSGEIFITDNNNHRIQVFEYPATTWNGTTWSAGAPTSTIDAVIASSTTPGAFTCKDLTINSTYSLTLNSGVTATIHGDLTNSGNGTSGTGTLDFAGGAAQSLSGSAFTHAGVIEVTTGTTLTTNNLLTIGNGGSLMHGTGTDNGGGSISGNITVEKTIGSTTDGWRSFSLPVDDLIDNLETGLNTRCSNTSPTDRHNVYYWNGTVRGGSSNNVAEGWTVANNTTDDENKGYAIYLSNNSSGFFDFSSTISISGTPNDGSKTFNLDNTFDPEGDSSTSTQRGWNLIPNYFPSNLSVEDLINDGDFDPTYKAVHIWDQGAEQLKAINSSGLTNYNTSGGSIYSSTRQIPPFMSFWVKANANSQSIQLKNHMRTGRNDSLPANTFLKTNADILRLQVQDQENHIDQYSVAFIQNSTEDFDPEYDLYKFKSFSTEVPTIYSMHGPGDKLSLNALPLKEEYSIPLYFESYKNGRQYTISPITAEYSNHYNVELTDNKTAVTTDLLEKDYSFTHDKDYKNARFTLKLKRKTTTTIAELQNNERSYAYTNGNGINIVYRNNNKAALSTITIYNTLGQQLHKKENIQTNTTTRITPRKTNTAAEIYIIKIDTPNQKKTLRVVY